MRRFPRTAAPLSTFAMVAGTGWMVDTLIALCLARLAHLPVAMANMISALTIASLVYIISRTFIHGGRRDNGEHGLLIFIVYTVAMIVGMSIIMDVIARHLTVGIGAVAALIVGKILITPPQFFLNFYVSRYLATREGRAAQ